MWQRFTEHARKVVFYAQSEAQNRGESFVEPEHLLLGMFTEEGHPANTIIHNAGLNREEIWHLMPPPPNTPPKKGIFGMDMTLSPRGKAVIDLAYRECQSLGDNFIGTEHLLLGLVAEGEQSQKGAIHSFSLDMEEMRAEVVKRRGS